MPKREKKNPNLVAVRLSDDLLREIDAIKTRWAEERPGVDVTRSDVIRVFLMQGLRAAGVQVPSEPRPDDSAPPDAPAAPQRPDPIRSRAVAGPREREAAGGPHGAADEPTLPRPPGPLPPSRGAAGATVAAPVEGPAPYRPKVVRRKAGDPIRR